MTQNDLMREGFEKWAKLGSEPYDLSMHERGYYINSDTLNAWYGYQAATQSALEAAAKVAEQSYNRAVISYREGGEHTLHVYEQDLVAAIRALAAGVPKAGA